MEFRIATISDINRIMDIIRQAQEYLRNKGVDQWQDNYPNLNIIRDDIEKRKGYVLEKDGQVVAIVAISFSDEKTYEKIYEGKWITENEYAVIHRIAVTIIIKVREYPRKYWLILKKCVYKKMSTV